MPLFTFTRETYKSGKEPNFPLQQKALLLHNSMFGTPKKAFSPNTDFNTIHTTTEEYHEKLKVLQRIDKHLAIAFAVGAAAFVLSIVFPLTLVAMVGFAYGAYQLALRQHAYHEYTQALQNSMDCVEWSLGNVSQSERNAITQNIVIRDMLCALRPAATAEQLYDRIDDKIENEVVADATKRTANLEIDGIALSEKQRNLYYTLYGLDQGYALDIAKGVAFEIQNGFNYLMKAFNAPAAPVANTSSAPAPR